MSGPNWLLERVPKRIGGPAESQRSASKKDCGGKLSGMASGVAHHDGVDIAYETFGSSEGVPLLLIMGAAAQMLLWDEGLCTELANRGFAVARFDNRDVGLSTHFSTVRSRVRAALKPSYRVQDMAEDAVAVIDALGWGAAHVVGMSLGGYLAQLTAIRHPSRIRSLTLVCTLPGTRPRYINYRPFLALARRVPPCGGGPSGASQVMVEVFRLISPRYPVEESWARELGRRCFERDSGAFPRGLLGPLTGAERQMLTALRCRDLVKALAGVSVPTLVIHGEADPVVRLRAAQAIADAIPGSRLVSYPGMGHWPARELWPTIVDEICALTA